MSLYCVDIETSGLLNDFTVDYTASPWKLRDNFKIHCIVIESLETGEVFEFVGDDCSKFKDFVLNTNITGIIAHNGISFDLTVLKVAYGMDFELGFEDSPSKWCGKEVEIIDTLMLSKTLFPDRQGHSLDYLGNLCGVKKIDWRAQAIELGLIEYSAEKGDEFLTYHPKMLEYNKQDVKTNIAVYKMLMKEKREWDKWDDAIQLEQYVAWIISRQEHRGFWFDRELADKNVRELDALMLEHKNIVEPHLPQKPLGKTKLKEYTAPATQFKKDGTPSSHIEKFIARHGGELQNRIDGYYAVFENKEFQLPLLDPIKTHEDALISDSTFIKEFLVGIGWEPSEFKEKDLTLDVKKRKLSAEKFKETVQRYVDKTLASNFCKFRLTKVNATRDALLNKLLRHDMSKPLKVLTNPTFTVGQEKQIDPALERLVDTFPYVKNIVEYLTYNHRRNSILGGGFDIEDEEEAETGFIPNMRSDGRIPTPADSCGCATARMKHRIICNIPRVTSLYGAPIRALFGVGAGNGAIQFAYDFCSLEAMIESHYCWKYDMTENKEYCNSLIQEKPNDVHTLTAKKISEMLGREFSRGNSKAVKYACAYGAQAPKVAKTIGSDLTTGELVFEGYWEAAKPLADLKIALTKYWETKGGKKFILGIDGRKIMTRSKHSLVNALFQSAGVICAKRTMVYQDIAFREAGISVDFWKEDWKNKDYIQQLIAYHK